MLAVKFDDDTLETHLPENAFELLPRVGLCCLQILWRQTAASHFLLRLRIKLVKHIGRHLAPFVEGARPGPSIKRSSSSDTGGKVSWAVESGNDTNQLSETFCISTPSRNVP